MKAMLALGRIPPVFTAMLRRKAKTYTLEADAWQNNEGNGQSQKGLQKDQSMVTSLQQWGIFRNTEGVTQHKTVSL